MMTTFVVEWLAHRISEVPGSIPSQVNVEKLSTLHAYFVVLGQGDCGTVIVFDFRNITAVATYLGISYTLLSDDVIDVSLLLLQINKRICVW